MQSLSPPVNLQAETYAVNIAGSVIIFFLPVSPTVTILMQAKPPPSLSEERITKMASGGKQNDKKKVHYVPSRYKQAAEKSQDLQVSKNVFQDSASTSKYNTSEDKRGMTSTPTSTGKLALPSLDASAVAVTAGHLNAPHFKERIRPLTADSIKQNLTKKYKSRVEVQQSHQPVTASYREKKKNDTYNQKIAEAEMDLLYTYYLQAAFFENEAKKALEARSSSALEVLHKLFTLVLQHLYKVKSKTTTLKILSSLIELHEHCQKQEAILKPVFEAIPDLEKQYECLADAVNCSKHKLRTKDVQLPELDCEEDIKNVVLKMREFISRFFEKVPNYKDVNSSSDALKTFADASELIIEALKKCFEKLIEARDLCFSEASHSICV